MAKRRGVEKLTPARALIAELVRRYWVLGLECSLLKFTNWHGSLSAIERFTPNDNPLDLRFSADKYGPYAERLRHMLKDLDSSYLHCDKRISDAGPLDVIWFSDKRRDYLQACLKGADAKPHTEALESTAALIDGFRVTLRHGAAPLRAEHRPLSRPRHEFAELSASVQG